MNQQPILGHVHQLVEEERALRASGRDAGIGERLTQIEEELDQCWDMLRQRGARRDVGDNPKAATVRSAEAVERCSD